MILSDMSIRKMLEYHPDLITPTPEDSAIQPASVDLHLAGDFLYQQFPFIEGVPPDNYSSWLGYGDYFTLDPRCFVLASTAEEINVLDSLVGRVEGKSSWGRQGLMIHSTAGFIDPGFRGNITLELFNLSTHPLKLQVGEPIAQIAFFMLSTQAQRPYGHEGLGSRYQDQQGVTPARFVAQSLQGAQAQSHAQGWTGEGSGP